MNTSAQPTDLGGTRPAAPALPADLSRAAELAAGLVDVLYLMRLEPDMAFEYVSPSVEAMVGYTPQEHYDDPQLGMRLLDPRDLDVLVGAAQAEFERPVDFTVRWVARDGHLVWTHHRCVKQRRDDGSVVLYGAARDITQEHETFERYRLLAENGTDVVVESSMSGVITWVSASITNLLGWRPEDLVGTSCIDLLDPDDHDVASAAFDDVANGQIGRFDARMRNTAGEVRWVSVLAKPVLDESGIVVGRVEGWRDVHLERQARDALTKSEVRFRMMVENATDVVFHTVEGIVEWVSPSVTTVTGWLPEDLIGRTTAHLWHPDDRAAAIAMRDATYAGTANRGEFRYLSKDGSYIWIDVSMQPYLEPDGRTGAVRIMRDVTDRVHAEQELVRSEALYRDLAENMSDVVCRVDASGLIEWMSPSVHKALGWTPDQLVGSFGRDLIHPDDLDFARASRERAIGKSPTDPSSPDPIELRYRTADGPYVWMSVRGQVLRDLDKIVVGGIYALRDIDLQVATREALEVSESKYHQLADMTLDMVITFDVNGFADYVSPSVTRVLGWGPDEFAVLPLTALIDADYIDEAKLATEQAIASHDPQTIRIRALTSTGERRWVDVTLQSRPAEEDGVLVAIRDVEEAVVARTRLAASERVVRAALDHAPSGMCVVAPHGDFLMVNRAMCRILGRDEDALLKSRWPDVTHPDDIEDDRQVVTELFSGVRDTATVMKRYVRLDGTIVACELNVATVRDDLGNVQFFVSQMTEVE